MEASRVKTCSSYADLGITADIADHSLQASSKKELLKEGNWVTDYSK